MKLKEAKHMSKPPALKQSQHGCLVELKPAGFGELGGLSLHSRSEVCKLNQELLNKYASVCTLSHLVRIIHGHVVFPQNSNNTAIAMAVEAQLH